MKRVLSLVLVLVLALGSVPLAFAADNMTAGQELKELGLVKGDSQGDLNEDSMLTRAEMMVMISRLLGVEEEAKNYAIPSTSKDVEGHWAAKYIAYAEQVGKWTSGVGENMFGADGKVTTQMAAKFMLTALGFEANWDTAVADATALGLMKGVTSEATANITRGGVFTASLNTINTPKKDSTVKLGVTLGVIKEDAKTNTTLDGAAIDEVKAVGSNLVRVEFEKAVDMDAAAAATYVITKKSDATKTIAVNKVNVESTTVVTLETAEMTKGDAYKLSVSDLTSYFTGIEKETSAPKISSVKGIDTGIVEVKFDMNVDKSTAEDIANYSINTIGTVTAAKITSDRDTVELTVEGFTKTASHKLTVENVLSVDGKVMTKTVRTFYPSFDKSAATIKAIKNVNNNNNKEIYVFFNDDHGVDKASAEDISNYSISGLEIISASASEDQYDSAATYLDEFSKDSDYYNRVLLVTSTQKANTKYTLKVNNVVDGSTAKNVPTKELSDTFYGASEDKNDPTVKNVTVLSSTLLRVEFNEINKLDPATALDVSNYSIDKDELTIVEAKFKDDEDDSKFIDITVSEMENNTSYRLKINNISDVFNNAMDKEVTRSFTGKITKTAERVIDAVATDENTVEVTFSGVVTEKTAEEATNYVLDGNIGSPTKAKFKTNSTTVVVLTFPDLTANKTYKVTVTGVENYSGYATDAVTKSFVASAFEADTKKPTVENVSFENRGLLKIEFSEEMKATGSVVVTAVNADGTLGTAYTLAVKSVTGEDDNILVFDATAVNDANLEKTINITSFTAVTDVAGNLVDYTDGEEFAADGTIYSAVDNSAEIVGWSQESVKEIKVFFGADVKVVTKNVNLMVGSTATAFTLKVDSDDDTVVIATLDSGRLSQDSKVIMNISAAVTDLAARASKDYSGTADVAKVTYTMFIKDETNPTIVEVVAVDNTTVEIKYDEELAYAGTYSLKLDGKTHTISKVELDEDVVTLTVATLDADKNYDLTQGTLARDLSNNSANKDDFQFTGTDVVAENTTLAGIAVINGYTLKVSDTDDLIEGSAYAISGLKTVVTKNSLIGTTSTVANATNGVGTATPNTSFNDDSLILSVEKITPFVKGQTYTVTVPSGYVNSTITVKGIVESGALTATASGTTLTVTLDGFSNQTGSTPILGFEGNAYSTADFTAYSVNADTNVITFTLSAAGVAKYTSTSTTTNVIVTILDNSGNPILTTK